MIDEARRTELGAFLRARRTELDPTALGLVDGGRRRVSGLRREEVARLAAISNDYYTRLEQGRRQASEPVLESLARVLRLDEAERVYLFALSGREPGSSPRDLAQQVQPQLRRLLDDLRTSPGVVVGRRTDVLAWNSAAAGLFLDFAQVAPEERNLVQLIFTEPAMRSLYADWDGYARATVGQLRREAVRDPDDPRLQELVAELSARDPDFRRWWGDHRVGFQGAGRKVFRHPRVGELVLDWSSLISAADPDQQLVTFTAEPGSPSAQRLAGLVSPAQNRSAADRALSSAPVPAHRASSGRRVS